MGEPRVIKKYPNRRLYDTVESRYITLADVRKLVIERGEFIIVDQKTREDITRCILLQVIAEQELAGEPLMSRDFLSHVIRSYGGGIMQGVVGSYLEQSLKLFATQQSEMRSQPQGGGDVAAVTQRNFQRWRTVQDEIFRALTGCAVPVQRTAENNGAPTR